MTLTAPQRGQPLDVAYINSLVDAINRLTTDVASVGYKYSRIDVANAGEQTSKTSELRVIGGIVTIATEAVVTAGSDKTFVYNFSDFKFPPIVTATAVNTGSNTGESVTIILKQPTTSRVEGTVKFNASGTVSLAVNLIIVGIPN